MAVRKMKNMSTNVSSLSWTFYLSLEGFLVLFPSFCLFLFCLQANAELSRLSSRRDFDAFAALFGRLVSLVHGHGLCRLFQTRRGPLVSSGSQVAAKKIFGRSPRSSLCRAQTRSETRRSAGVWPLPLFDFFVFVCFFFFFDLILSTFKVPWMREQSRDSMLVTRLVRFAIWSVLLRLQRRNRSG